MLETNDEGIILDAAERLLHGQRLYLDFFGYMSPGSYWIQEIAFRALGVTMLAGRIPVLADVAVQCGLAIWLARLLMPEGAARACLALFFALRCSDLTELTAQHRLDSASFSLAALCCAIQGHRAQKRRWFALAGALAAAGAICTPSIALVGAVIAGWILMDRRVPRCFGAFAAGAGVIAAGAWFVLWREGSVYAFFQQMLWLQKNYSSVNRVAYGEVFGGYRALMLGGGPAEIPVRGVMAFWIAVPALAPIVALGGARFLQKELSRSANPAGVDFIPVVAATALALVVSTYPRMDATHLGYILPVPLTLAFAVVNYLPARKLQIVLVILLSLAATASLYVDLGQLLNETALDSPVGRVRVRREEAPALRALLGKVAPGESLYVHPYRPLFYFLTQARNPTRFSYLAPGMMSDAEANAALESLAHDPPAWLLYLWIDAEDYLRIFPSADPQRVHYRAIEAWIASRYSTDLADVAGYQLLRRTTGKGARAGAD